MIRVARGIWSSIRASGRTQICARSDSFKPWHSARFTVDAPTIKNYLREVATRTASMSTFTSVPRSCLPLGRTPAGAGPSRRFGTAEELELEARFVFMCSGYYNYDAGYRPNFPGEENFGGPILQPQHRPRDLDYAGKERRRYRQRRRAHNDAATFANIDRFTRTGHELAADIIFYRNRIELVAFGGAKLGRNGQDVDVSKSMTYKSMLLSDVPTMAFTMGYINASWTLRADLVSEYVCRLLNCMDARATTPS